ncbi:MAG: DUF1552 domain-containing protein [Planctomycetales bacterium]|nr:DUF1552 domain-containing protein [Planctomycetales bacterium]
MTITLSRRTMLQGAGIAMALPWLECMAETTAAAAQPRRLCCVMFPYGVAMPKDSDPDRQWGWFPTGKDRDFELTNVLRSLEPLRSDFSVFTGLSHPRCRGMNGHDTGDTFLTGNSLAPGTYRNTVSLDQLAAAQLGADTRLGSLSVSTDGGIGPRTRATTLSYDLKGQPVPALADPQLIFNRLFGQDKDSREGQRRLANTGSILDLVREHSRSLKRELGSADQRKLDEFETSVRDVERRVDRTKRWLSVPLPEVNKSELLLDVNPDAPREYIRTMYDLIYLAFQTDITRVATYQLGSYGPTLARTFPACLGLPPNWHSLAHNAGKNGGPEAIGKFDQFLAENLARFLTRLKETPEHDGNLLSRTLVLYGSSNSRTHVNRNYPLLLAGGDALGLRHNQYLHYAESTPLANLFVSMLAALDVPAAQFADSTGQLAELG